ncbi:MAG: hypothetical protein LBQ64_06720 [Bacteroidales bacterium]|jgi:hypothetical protein|nr:hypothetical protein [Bacteroidales bacterium]
MKSAITENKNNQQKIHDLLDKYFEGKTTVAEEQTLRSYFQQTEIEPELKEYASLFAAWNSLYLHGEYLPEEPNIFIQMHSVPQKRLSWLRIGTTTAVAIAAVILFFFIQINPKKPTDFVVIDGVSYTDKAHLNKALETSLHNVRIDIKDVLDELQNVYAEE